MIPILLSKQRPYRQGKMCRSILRLFGAVFYLSLLTSTSLAYDYEWTFDNNSFIDYTLTSVSSSDLYTDALPANDPAINLIMNKRYRIFIVNPGPHPLDILAKGAVTGSDIVLLSQGSFEGSFETDADVSWQDFGDGYVEFTLTSNLIAAMREQGNTPGYRCRNHASTMRGDFNVFGEGIPIGDPLPDIPKGTITIELETLIDGLTSPLGVVEPDDGTGRLFVYDQTGIVTVLVNGAPLAVPFLDVSDRLVPLGISGSFDENDYDERGLLGLAFHPEFSVNQKLYTFTSEPVESIADFTVPLTSGAHNHQSVIAEWTTDSANPNQVLVSSRRELVRIDEPQFNHDGGGLQFGPDGFLYIALGDGGAADDQGEGHGEEGNGQNINTILGSIIRIDVNGDNSANGQYGVPPDNPFVGTEGVDEIYAYGFRNPYRFSFDPNGILYVADVGQNLVEEITVVSNGENHGWRHKEGSFFFDANGSSSGFIATEPAAPLPPEPLIDPIAQYDHDDGTAIVGGFVYHDTAIPELNGFYVFGDFSTGFSNPNGRLFYLDSSNQIYEFHLGANDDSLGLYLKGFGQDRNGAIYVCASSALGPFGNNGKVLKIVPSTSSASAVWELL